MDDLEEVIKDQQIEVAILTIPAQQAQEVTDRLVSANIRGILNFTPCSIDCTGKCSCPSY